MRTSRAAAWRRIQSEARFGANIGYGRFLAMILVATAVIYGLMYLTVADATHIQFSQVRFWRAVAMGAALALIMLAFMLSLYRKRSANAAIIAGAGLAILVALWMVRSQRTVDDIAYLKAMIPHQSMSVLTSTRARIRDERVRQLADAILESRLREIAEMKRLISELERSPPSADAPLLRPADQALAGEGRAGDRSSG